MSRSPAAILYDADGIALAVADATAPPANTPGFIGVGYDGTYARFIRVDASGYQVSVGAGVAGSPAGGVVSVQGVSGGQALVVADGGGSITIDTTQLPTVLLGGRLDTNIGAWLGSTVPTVGQKPLVSSIPVAIAADQSAIPVTQGTPPWKVEGTDADGAPPTENPVLVAGWDGTNVETLQVILDGTVYRLQAESLIVGKTVGVGANKQVTVVDDATLSTTKRLQVEADIAPGATIGIAAASLVAHAGGFLTDSGGSEDLIVNGSGTPVEFTYEADPAEDIFLRELRVIMSCNGIGFDGDSFGKGHALTNGLLVEVTVNDGAFYDLINVKINEDMLRFATSQGINLFSEFSAATDVLVASYQFSGREKLVAGSSDELKITVRDNYTNVGLYGMMYLTATFSGYTEDT